MEEDSRVCMFQELRSREYEEDDDQKTMLQLQGDRETRRPKYVEESPGRAATSQVELRRVESS